MTQLFLSYARTPDEPFVKKLYTSLTDNGYDVWWDRQKMPNRDLTFLQEIRDAITESQRLILVGYPKSFTSDYVRQEWEYALSICTPVLTLLRDGDYTDIPDTLKDRDIPDFRDNKHYKAKLDYLLRQLEDSPAPLGTLYNVPALPQWYVARPTYLTDLIQTVCADTHKPVVITSKQHMTAVYGLGGIGKTTLANALSRDCTVRRTFPDGIFWLEIGQTPDIAARLGDIGVALGDQRAEYPDEARAKSRLSAQLANKQALLILDDVWDHQHGEVFRLAGNRCRLLMTTRQLQIATKLGAIKRELDTLTDEEGLSLIAERLKRPADAPNPHQADQIAIIHLLGGHTLAVSLAAALLDERGEDYTPKLLERLNKKGVFHDLQMDDKDKNHNLELCLSLSYGDLLPDQQRYFRLLGVFAPESSFSAAAAASVWEMDDPDDAEDALTNLVRAGLLKREPDDRYSLHMLLCAYAQALLTREGEQATSLQRHFDYYYTKHGDLDLNNDEQRHPQITSDFSNLQNALDWGWVNQPEEACKLVNALNYYMQLYQSFSTRRALLQRALSTANQIAYALGQANTLKALGDLDRMEADYPNARAHYQAALPMFEAIPSRLGQANTLQALGDLDRMEADYPNARAHYQAALPMFEAIPSRLGQANTLQALGDLDLREADYPAARQNYLAALPMFEAIPSRLGQANTLRALGDLDRMEADYPAARQNYLAALPMFEAIPSRLGQANTLQALGDLDLREADYPAARQNYLAALPMFEAIPSRLGQANTLRALGDLDRMEADYPAARQNYQAALPMFEAIPNRLGQANTLQALGDLDRMEADYPAARVNYQDALIWFLKIPNRVGQMNTYINLARLETALNNTPAACDYYEKTFAIADQIPTFANHPVVQGWRKTYSELCGGNSS